VAGWGGCGLECEHARGQACRALCSLRSQRILSLPPGSARLLFYRVARGNGGGWRVAERLERFAHGMGWEGKGESLYLQRRTCCSAPVSRMRGICRMLLNARQQMPEERLLTPVMTPRDRPCGTRRTRAAWRDREGWAIESGRAEE